jgi:hypothetical protein
MTGSRPIAYLVDVVPQPCFNAEARSPLSRFYPRSADSPLIAPLSFSDRHIDRTFKWSHCSQLHLRRGEPLQTRFPALHAMSVIDYSQSYFVPGYFHFHVIRRVVKPDGEFS